MAAFTTLVRSYKWWFIGVLFLGIAANGLALYIPKLSGQVIDRALQSEGIAGSAIPLAPVPDIPLAGTVSSSLTLLCVLVLLTFIVAAAQVCVSTYFSEKVALDLRGRLISKLSRQSFSYISTASPGRLITLATSDVEAVKAVIAQGLVALLGAAVTLLGASILLISTNWRLGLATLSIIPLMLIAFAFIFKNLSRLFVEAQANIEKINALINETIIGSALIRVLSAAKAEVSKFAKVNEKARDAGLGIVKNISALIPIVTLLANASVMIIIWFGGRFVVAGTLSVGSFSAFLSYSSMLIWPLFVLSFVGTGLSRGGISLKRINETLDAPIIEDKGTFDGKIRGDIEFKNVSLSYRGKPDEGGEESKEEGELRTVLKGISFSIRAGTKNAIVGPTAAGKTQLFCLMSGLVAPTEGEIFIDGRPIGEYQPEALLKQIGLVFQDSIMFNATLRENIAFSDDAARSSDEALEKAVRVSELGDLVNAMPEGLDTLVSERGTSLSGGQKQRVMLARSLAVDPQILLLDDFTARVDQATEASILKNVSAGYPDVTLVSITQKVEPIKEYDHIIVLMEGELVAQGRHEELLSKSFEYRQVYESQQTTEK